MTHNDTHYFIGCQCGNDDLSKKDDSVTPGSYFFAELGDKAEVPQAYFWYVEDTSAAANSRRPEAATTLCGKRRFRS